MMTRAALAAMLAAPALAPKLRRASVYEILQPGQQPLAGITAVPVVTFSAVGNLRTALADNQIPPGTGAVLYDPENWSFTPSQEQRDPAGAAAQAAGLAHAHGLQLIVAPGLTLTKVLDAASPAPLWQRYLTLGLAAAMAPAADVLEIQAQSLERDAGTYATFVRQAAAQARAANPRISVLAGLSTNPPGAVVTSQQLTAAIGTSRSVTDGYWLNIPGNGPRCPTCNPTRPDIGAAVLGRALG